ncbi:HNH endonuclease [Rhizobium ruizarguesonis]|uniref:HNH endonuclease n=1 Tax=Rhizobium ruizarguesonis TaxID=2081791 RepID=UPI0013EE551F|nr:HNH endonuclease signature motif containing protein [Rhizobium ruizarguesonis]
MSSQVFSAQVREAIWKAHGHKCLYCTEPLLFTELVIDHIIPEATTRVQLQAIIEGIGLRSGFDIYNWENHAPVCYPCNKRKLDTPFHDALLSIILKKIEAKLPMVEELIKKAKEDWELDKVLRTIAKAVDGGNVTHDDIIKHVEFMKRFPHGIRGSRVPAPPASPEKRVLGIEFSGLPIKVRLAPAVQDYIDDLQITVGQLASQVEESVITRHFQIKTSPAPSWSHLVKYYMSLDTPGEGETNLEFEMSDDTLDITGVSLHKKH